MSNPRVSLFEDKKKGEKLNKLELNISTILAEISGQNSNIEYNPDDPFSTKSPSNVTLQYFFWKN